MRPDLPSGTVTFLFTDVEGSTRLLDSLGAEAYAQALAEHRRVIREACASEGGVEVDTQGDAFFFAFPTAPGALAAASAFTEALASGLIQVRVGLHTGTPLVTEEGYVGGDVHRAARIAACGHGGQVLVSSSTAQLVELELTDLGEHRLKDLSAPERIHQLGAGDFPALKSLYRTNLPVPATPFLGREAELSEVVGLLERVRLLTLTGPGGSGKTRLAAQAAGMAADGYPDGVWWIPLAPLRDPDLVVATASQVVGAQNGLAEHIADKSMLLLFDNFEQVVEAAGDVAGLLASCPNLDLLVTSREPLHLAGEQEYAVRPLVHEEGVDFFVARARAIRPDFTPDEAVSEICARLDDLPLALELAAARVKGLTTTQILERLDERLPLLTGGARDLPERQRTLRATVEWSYDLLSVEEQSRFARLAVFRGGCTLEAAEQVCDADLDTMQSLVDKSLLRFTNERYWMLETIREYASERLEDSGEGEELSRQHAEWFLAYAEETEPRALLGSPDEKELLDRIAREHDNLRATLDHLEAVGDGEHVLRLTGAMWPLWALRGPIAEGQRWLEHALAFGGGTAVARAHAITGLISLGELEGEALWARAEEELALFRELGDAWGATHAVFMLGFAAAELGSDEIAQQHWEEALDGFQEVGDEHFATLTRDCLAWVYAELGDRRRATALNEDNLRRAREASNRRAEAFALDGMAMLKLDEGRVEEAVSLLNESVALYRALEVPAEAAECLCYLAATAAVAGPPERAVSILSTALSRFDDLGVTVPFWVVRRNERTLAVVRGQLDDPALDAAWEVGAKMSLDEALALALGGADT